MVGMMLHLQDPHSVVKWTVKAAVKCGFVDRYELTQRLSWPGYIYLAYAGAVLV